MTLPDTPSKEIKNGNDVATVFSFDFIINQASDLQVNLNDDTVPLTEGTGTSNYSVSLSSTPGAGSITYPATLDTELPTGDTLTLSRQVDLDQESSFKNQTDYDPNKVEQAIDYSRMVDQQQQEELDRSLKVQISDDSGADYTIPAPNAGSVLGIWDATGLFIEEGPTASAISGAQQEATDAAASAAAALVSENEAAVSAATAQAAVNGLKWKPSAKAASTGDLTLSGTQTVDGIALVVDDICLAKNQTAPAENGLYTVAAGVWTRITEMDEWGEVPSAATIVEEGTVNADVIFLCTSDQGGTIDVTAITWAVYGNVSASSTTTFTNKTIDADGAGNVITNIDIGNAIAASQAEAEAGTDNTKLVTSLRVAQAIAALETGGITLETSVATTSGTAIDFTSIPAGTKRIQIIFAGISTNGSSHPIIQIGSSGSPETTGYLGSAGIMLATSDTTSIFTTGFGLTDSTSSSALWGGIATLDLLDAATNTWAYNSVVGYSNAAGVGVGGGSLALSGNLDIIRLTTEGGANAFDAGIMNINYEG